MSYDNVYSGFFMLLYPPANSVCYFCQYWFFKSVKSISSKAGSPDQTLPWIPAGTGIPDR